MTVSDDRCSIPYDYDFHEDPYPYYQRLRDEAPLYHNRRPRLLGAVATP